MAADIVVVGGGVMGAATAWALAMAGRQVTLLEQYRFGHSRGSSHGRSRIFRFSYPDPMYVAMAMEAQELWRGLERDGDREGELLLQTGGLDAGEGIGSNVAALEGCGAKVEMLSGAEATKRYPHLSFPSEMDLLYQPDGGVVAAEEAIETFRSMAEARGAQLRDETQVERIEPGDNNVGITVNGNTIRASAVIVTAGAWVRDLVRPLGIEVPVRPTRETVAYFRTSADSSPTLVEWGDPTVYSQPSPGHSGIKVGEHVAGPEAAPGEEGPVDQVSIARLSAWVAERYVDANAEPFHAETCFYTNTDDQRFILERHGRVIVGSPCSGHGFKFAPVIGKRLAALAEEVL